MPPLLFSVAGREAIREVYTTTSCAFLKPCPTINAMRWSPSNRRLDVLRAESRDTSLLAFSIGDHHAAA